MTLAIAALTFTIITPNATGKHRPDDPPQACADARKAIRWYRSRYNEHRARMGASIAPRIERNMGCRRARERARYWQHAASVNRAAADRWVREQFDWWRWMPRGSKEYRVASCETGYGKDPNFAHDSGTYVSAWGIYRPAYADDAHRAGNLSWDETLRARGTVPTPREQYEAMMAHRAAHGGWAGWGCRGA